MDFYFSSMHLLARNNSANFVKIEIKYGTSYTLARAGAK